MTHTIKSVSAEYNNFKIDPNKDYFVGDYIAKFAELAVVSLLTGQHVSIQTPPGYGKTDVLDTIAKHITPNNYARIDLLPSSNPAVFNGVDDPVELINNGRFIKKLEGTPYDPNMLIVIADELFRANDPTFDAALHALDPKKQDHCVVWATNNFVAKGERVEALLDRIGLWYWVKPDDLNTAEILHAMMSKSSLEIPHWLPTWEQVQVIRDAVPGQDAINAVTAAIEEIVAEAKLEGFANIGHPRSLSQMWKMLYYASVLITGDDNFNRIPEKARQLLRYVYPAKSYEEARNWETFISFMTDKLEAEISRILADNVNEFKKVAAMKDPADRAQAAVKLGQALSNAQMLLQQQFPDGDKDKIDQCITTLSKWHTAAVLGNLDVIKM